MIAGKTAAIVRFAAWAGALAGGASRATADVLGAMGEALGMGFQVRDDVLGIWGARSDTGKDEADDIRRRKKSLPVLLLHERASEGERERLAAIYRADEIEPEGVSEVLTLLDRHDIAGVATSHVRTYHEAAATALERARPRLDPTAADGLASLIARMDTRVS
jgi:geranylgeranyl diphosphate synthase type I